MEDFAPNHEAPRLLRSYETTRLMLGGIGLTSLGTLVAEGKLKRIKIGRRSFITDDSIHSYISDQSNRDK